MSEKLTDAHRGRAGVVYVRQSTMDQVRHHLESQRRQYGLASRARELGFVAVDVIDDDLGRSGSGCEDRPGFSRLVAAVCEGRVGAVFVVEASRLARNGRDWHHLIDLCGLTQTLVIDPDGVYDPRLVNDRLLLGLKGTMAEFELALLRQRSQEALRQMIQRGETLWDPPVGYIRTVENRLELSPDRQVQQAVRGVFAKFQEVGSARQVLLWYRQEKIPLPSVIPRSRGHEVVWKLPVYQRIISILRNPVYAGAFVWGRRCSRTVVVSGRARTTAGHEQPLERWGVLLRDHHEGYIAWEQYLRNREQLRRNSAMEGRMSTGAAKQGAALLAGLLRCARCGRKAHVAYTGVHGGVPRYQCRGAQINHGEAWCISFGSLRCDEAVAKTVLESLAPIGINASLRAWEELCAHEDQKQEALRLAVEKAEYHALLARRQYDAVDPDNRLVAAELEKRWNDALVCVAEAKNRLTQAGAERQRPTEAERRRLLDLGRELAALWNHPEASSALKKRILRTALDEIVVDVRDDPPEVVLILHWAGGVHTGLRVPKNRTGQHHRCTDRKVVDLVRELAQVCDDASTARILNLSGYRTGQGNTWTQARVRSLRGYQQIAAFDATASRSWVTMTEATQELDVSATVVRRLLRAGILPGKQIAHGAPWIIERASLGLPSVVAAIRAVKSHNSSMTGADQTELPL